MRKTNSGFSLVEVTLALGIVTFGLIAILGLLPTGLGLVKESSDEAAAANIAMAISADIQSTDSTQTESPRYHIPLSTVGSGNAYFNADGKFLTKGTTAPTDAVYTAAWNIRDRTDEAPPTALITITWPAKSSKPTGRLETLLINPKDPS